MSDPAVDAAMRVAERTPDAPIGFREAYQRILTAREALKPIRELHSPGEKCTCCWGHYEDGSPVHKRRMCTACGVHWPCDTAKLVYSTEELES